MWILVSGFRMSSSGWTTGATNGAGATIWQQTADGAPAVKAALANTAACWRVDKLRLYW